MSTIQQKFSAGLGGLNFVSSNTIEANSVCVINDTFSLNSSTSQDFPIFAEGDTSGDIRMIAVEFVSEMAVCQFLDSSNNVVFDAVSANGANLSIFDSFIFPGNAPLTISGTNDITKVRLRTNSGFGNILCKIAIAYEVGSSDTIS